MAETIDHVPNRAAFPSRVGPEGFEFPACKKCQSFLRLEELFFAFFVRLSDRDTSNYDQLTSKRLIEGVRNNLPELFPSTQISAIQKRKALRAFGVEKPTNRPLSDIPMASFPSEIDSVLKKVIIKIGLALFYKHKNKIASLSHLACAFWTQDSDKKTLKNWEKIAQELSGFNTGSRKNVNLGNRFVYAWEVQEAGKPDIFVVVIQFGLGLVACAMICDASLWSEEEVPEGWISVEQWLMNS
ncbi:MAG: hypothetical protein AAGH53_14475 [Pseudomonadota bacterium]